MLISKPQPYAAGALALLGLSFLIPNHYSPWTSFHGELAAAAAMCLGFLAVWVSDWRDRARGVVPVSAIAVGALAAIPALQYLLGLVSFSGDAWVASLYLLGFAASIWMGHHFASTPDASRWCGWLAIAAVSVGIISVGIALAQWFRVGLNYLAMEMPLGGRPYANLAQPNLLATLLVLSLLGALALYEVRRIGFGTLVLLALYLLVGVSLTQSRAGLLESGALLFAYANSRRRVTWRIGWGQAVMLLLFLIAAYAAIGPLGEALHLRQERALGTGSLVPSGGELRLQHWITLLDALSRHPWSGYGWGQVAIAQATVVHDHPGTGEMIEYSHNVLLDVLLWNGVPIGLVLITIGAWWFWSRRRRLQSAQASIAMGVVTAVCAHALVEFPHAYLFFLLPVGLMIGAIERATSGATVAVLRGSALLGGLGTAAVTALVWSDYAAIESDYRLLRFEMASIGSIRSESAAPSVLMLDQLAAEIAVIRRPASQPLSPAELEVVRQVSMRFPSSTSIARYALALALNDDIAAADREIARIEATFGPDAKRRAVSRLKDMAMEGRPALLKLDAVRRAMQA